MRIFALALLALVLISVSARADDASQMQASIDACKAQLDRNVTRFCPCIMAKLKDTGGMRGKPEERQQKLQTAIQSCQNDELSGDGSK